jgi:hypothetical protein
VTRAILVALSNPADPAVEDVFNKWYEDQHLPDVLAVEGVRAATRFRLADDQLRDDAPYRYLAVYEIDHGVVERLKTAKASGHMPGSDATDIGPAHLWTLVSHHEAPA